jgi:hypothetical protein
MVRPLVLSCLIDKRRYLFIKKKTRVRSASQNLVVLGALGAVAVGGPLLMWPSPSASSMARLAKRDLTSSPAPSPPSSPAPSPPSSPASQA